MTHVAWILALTLGGLVSSSNSAEVTVRETEIAGAPWLTEQHPNFLHMTFDHEGRDIKMHLRKNHKMSRRFLVTFADNTEPILSTDLEDVAFYQDRDTMAAVAVTSRKAGGRYNRELDGTFMLDNDLYSVEPLRWDWSDRKRSFTDGLHLVSRANITGSVMKDVTNYNMQQFVPGKGFESSSSHRQTRQTDPPVYDVEMRIIADFTVWEYWMDKKYGVSEEALEMLIQWYSLVINSIDMVYSTIDPSVHGFGINIWLKELHIARTECESPWTTGDSIMSYGDTNSETTINYNPLYKLMDWVHDGRDWTDADMTMLFTKYDIVSADVNGYGIGNGVCAAAYAVGFTEDDGDGTWLTAAQHIGANLGASRDGCADEPGVMGPTQTSQFAECSIAQIGPTLTDGFVRTCLRNKVCHHASDVLSGLPPLDMQCQLYKGNSYSTCNDRVYDDTICSKLHCASDGGAGVCMWYTHGAYQYTPCAEGKVCNADKQCVTLADHALPDENCEETSWVQPVPEGCEDEAGFSYEGSDCANLMLLSPWNCFVETVATGCCRSCHEFGLVP